MRRNSHQHDFGNRGSYVRHCPSRRADRDRAHAFEGGGFPVRRPFPGALDLQHTDPFLMLDQMGPVDYVPGQAKGAPITRTAASRPSPTCSTAIWSTAS